MNQPPPLPTPYLPAAIQKQLPNAVIRKVLEMDDVAQLGFLQEFSKRKKSTLLAFLLIGSGLHYAYLGRFWLSLLFIFTFGGFGAWFIIDLLRIASMVRERNQSISIEVLKDIQILR